jgi:hypothetical protein
MSQQLASFPDIETAIMDLLEDLVGTDSIGTSTTPDLGNLLPFIRVTRFGGADDRITDTARVDIDVFGATRPDAYPLAETVRQRMLAAPHTVNGVVIGTVTTDAAPTEVPWDDQLIRRWTASYQVKARRS